MTEMTPMGEGTKPDMWLGRAVELDRYGGPEVLELRRREFSLPRREEVLVRVHAAGLNPKDLMIRSGALRVQSGRTFPRGTGFDLAGEVVAVGEGVADLAHGASVWGFLDGVMGGSAADYVTVPRDWLGRMPASLGWLEAAAIPLVASAALQGLRDVARLRPGERVLIRGGSGGVGSAAIQIARSMDARVTAVTSGAGLEHCLALGADEVVDRRTTDPDALAAGFDVCLDCVGEGRLREYVRLLAAGGRWVSVAPKLSVFALAPFSRVLGPALSLPRLGFVMVRPVAADLEELSRLVAAGSLRMPVTAVHALDDIREAHAVLSAGGTRGKRVLGISPEAVREGTDGGSSAAPVLRRSVDVGVAR